MRGDANVDGGVDITHPIVLVGHLFSGAPQPPWLDAADADDSGSVELPDVLVLLTYLYQGAQPLPAPGPPAWFDPRRTSFPAERDRRAERRRQARARPHGFRIASR